MDINDLRTIMTPLVVLTFAGIVWWAFSDRRKESYEEAARMPLDDDSPIVPAGERHAGHPDK